MLVDVEGHLLDTGIWCPRCALPSGVRVAVVLAANPTVRLATIVECDDCGCPLG